MAYLCLRSIRLLTLLIAVTVAAGGWIAHAAEPATSEWVYPGADGKLVYKTTPAGDRIMDFSLAGYMGGGVLLPNVPVKRTVEPTGGDDDTDTIQAAIDAVAEMPLEDGFRGAVLLGPGTFHCPRTINIAASGVVLRGSGSGAEGGGKTTIKLTGKPHLAIAVRATGAGGSGRRRGAAQDGAPQSNAFETSIADRYVPSGAMSFTVNEATGFAVGDTISIRKPVTKAWVQFMQMDELVRDGRRQTWLSTNRTLTTERQIAAIDGNTITLDVPVSDSFDSKYLDPPGVAVVKLPPSARIAQVGIEHLHIESPPQEISHTQPHFTALRMNGQDCWVRDVMIDETMNSVGVSGRRITLQQVTVNRKARHQGSSKPAEFAPNGTQILLDRCSGTADNVWYAGTGAGHAGPIVLLHCTFHGNGRVESHQRWSTGVLYDNCRVPEGGMDFRNRGSMGSGHGWSMGWGVAWNCEAINSGFLNEGKLYCAHSNYPRTPERSEIKVLDVETMELSTFKDFGNFGSSLTWAVEWDGHWWCNFARYGKANAETTLVKFDSEWKEKGRWRYPASVIRKLGRYLNDISSDKRKGNLEWGTKSQNLADRETASNRGRTKQAKELLNGVTITLSCNDGYWALQQCSKDGAPLIPTSRPKIRSKRQTNAETILRRTIDAIHNDELMTSEKSPIRYDGHIPWDCPECDFWLPQGFASPDETDEEFCTRYGTNYCKEVTIGSRKGRMYEFIRKTS